ncbi:hypothetical protein N9137_01110 [Pseudomonadales bacterium]|nr:hypothetical protein [Pseudomonadales bacterium]
MPSKIIRPKNGLNIKGLNLAVRKALSDTVIDAEKEMNRLEFNDWKRKPEMLRVLPVSIGGNLIAASYTTLDIALFQDSGTKPHIIKPKRANALRFNWPKVGNKTTFVPKNGFPFTGNVGSNFVIGKGFVNHPGTKAKNFTGRAATIIQPKLLDNTEREIARSVR